MLGRFTYQKLCVLKMCILPDTIKFMKKLVRTSSVIHKSQFVESTYFAANELTI